MTKEKKNVFSKVKGRLLTAAVSVQTMILTAVPAFAETTPKTGTSGTISSSATGAATDAVTFMQGLGKPALMVVIGACGLIFLVGTQRQKDNWKDGLLLKVVGLGVLILAVPLANTIYGWFS